MHYYYYYYHFFLQYVFMMMHPSRHFDALERIKKKPEEAHVGVAGYAMPCYANFR